MRRFLLVAFSFCLSCFSAFAQQIKWNQTYQSYINKYKDVAIQGMLEYGVPASISLAQGLLESGAGMSNLSQRSNNHFGIKCHGWTGRTIYHDDDARGECFRAYNTVLESYEDHCLFLKNRPRYSSLFQLSRTDYKGWAYGLKKAGYATNPSYAQYLINIIELYQLYQYDNATSYDSFMVKHSSDKPMLPDRKPIFNGNDMGMERGAHTLHKYNDNYYIVVRPSDTFKSLSRELKISAYKLAKYNERKKKDKLQPGEFIWLQKKRKKAPKNFKGRLYTVRRAESLYDIAQKYGIRLKSLVKKNKQLAENGLHIGDQVILY